MNKEKNITEDIKNHINKVKEITGDIKNHINKVKKYIKNCKISDGENKLV